VIAAAPAGAFALGTSTMYRLVYGLSRFMAYIGGAMLVLLVILTCVSVIGRSLNGLLHGDLFQTMAPAFATWAIDLGVGPVNGDYELIESGVAFAIFAFLPLCQITNGHAAVEIFTRKFSPWFNRVLQFVIDAVFAAVLLLIAVQLYSGMLSKMKSGQTTFLLEFPVWWAYALSMTGAVVASAVGLFVAIVRLLELLGNKSMLPSAESAQH
jgi:TRAP-type C4-dicarboxylate transport system permease small subunit